MAFIDAHRGTFGVEPICEVLREHGVGIAPNTYHVAKKRPPSPRSVRDRELKIGSNDENLFVYGADKIWVNRENIRVARCTVERLMCQMGIPGRLKANPFQLLLSTTSIPGGALTIFSGSGRYCVHVERLENN